MLVNRTLVGERRTKRVVVAEGGLSASINRRKESFLFISCWMDPGDSIWFLAIPVILVISFNVLIVINVLRIIKRKRNVQSTEDSQVAGGPNSTASTLKAARAALMLIPILGIHFLLMPIRPEQGTTLEYFYEVFSALSSSYQGFFVSIIFCFLNNDVLDILKKKLCRRNRNFFNVDSTFVGRGGIRTTCVSVTTSPTGTARLIGHNATASIAAVTPLVNQQTFPLLQRSPMSKTSRRANSLTSTNNILMAGYSPTSLRTDRKKRKSCTGGIMTESIRLWPKSNGALQSSNDNVESVTHL